MSIRLPLAEDIVFEGVIYLKGTIGYPDSLIEALEQKKESMMRRTDSPIFIDTVPAAPPAPEPPTLSVSSINESDESDVFRSGFPNDFPAADIFQNAGYLNVEQIRAFTAEDLTQINGIGPSRAQQVIDWFIEHPLEVDEEPEDEDDDAAGDSDSTNL